MPFNSNCLFKTSQIRAPLKQLSLSILLAAALVALLGQSVWAENPAEQEDSQKSAIFSVTVENDGIGNDDDGNYTHGTRFSYLPDAEVPEWLRKAASYLPFFSQKGRFRPIYSLGQNTFTPEDIDEKSLIVDDRPYAGWLYVGLGLITESKVGSGRFNKSRDSLELHVGVVGPASLAEQVQTLAHEIRGATDPQGWDNQLENEPGIMLIYDRQWLGRYALGFSGLNVDLMPHIGAALGNVMTHAATGLTVRFGRNMGSDFGVSLIRPSAPGSTYFSKKSGLGWYLFAGAEGRAVLQNIFLDGNTFEDSHSVDKKYWVGDFHAGLVFTWGDYRLSFTNVNRSKEFDEQSGSTRYGSVSFSLHF